MSDHPYWCCDEGHYHPDNMSDEGPALVCECGARMRRVGGDWIAGRRVGWEEGQSSLVDHLNSDQWDESCRCDACKNLRPMFRGLRESERERLA